MVMYSRVMVNDRVYSMLTEDFHGGSRNRLLTFREF